MRQPMLNRRLTLQDLVRSPDGAGGYTETWAPLGNLWAQVRALSGREGEMDHAKLSKVGYDITVRSAPFDAPSRPKPEQRLVEGTRIFRIHAVTERDTSGRFLICKASEEVAT
ncbi:MAG: phage head closure protein [Planktomarina sp.]